MPERWEGNNPASGDAVSEIERANRALAEFEDRQRTAFESLRRSAAAATDDVERLNRALERDTARALSALVTESRTTTQALERVWTNFMDFFAARVVRGIRGALSGFLPSPGGVVGTLVGGVLGLFGLQTGGLVRGTREGTPVILGENFTDELVVPLPKLGLTAGSLPGSPLVPPSTPPPIAIYPQFVIENRMPLEPDLAIYRLSEQGRLRVATRTLTSPVSPARED